MTQLFDQFQVEKNGGMGGHQSARMKNDEWLTPPAIIEKLGTFDLDPCSPIKRPWSTASNHFTVEDDGRGFDPNSLPPGLPMAADRVAAGNGLSNVRRRLAEIGGSCEVESQPGHGTRVTFFVPQHPATH